MQIPPLLLTKIRKINFMDAETILMSSSGEEWERRVVNPSLPGLHQEKIISTTSRREAARIQASLANSSSSLDIFFGGGVRRGLGERRAPIPTGVAAASRRGPHLMNYVLKRDLIPHLAARALLVKKKKKSLETTDSVRSSAGPPGAG